MLMKMIIENIAKMFGVVIKRNQPNVNGWMQLDMCFQKLGTTVVFDVGANQGQFASAIRRNGYKEKIVSFEPLHFEHEYLKLKSSNDDKWIVHPPTAIGDAPGEVTINVSKNSVSSSILPMLQKHKDAAPESSYVKQIITQVQPLDLLSGCYYDETDKIFLKIDTQGYEDKVLAGADVTLQRATGILCELSLTELYAGQNNWLEIISIIESHGFKLWAIQPGFCDIKTGQTLQLDGLFVKALE